MGDGQARRHEKGLDYAGRRPIMGKTIGRGPGGVHSCEVLAMTRINYETCTNCGLCAKVCGGRIIRQAGGRYEVHSYEDWGCFGCGNCMAVCPSRSITVEGLSYDMFVPLEKRTVGFDPFYAALLSRRSVRNYTKKPVARQTIESVIRAAATCPMGVPPTDVEVLVIDRRADIEALLDDVKKQYRGFLFIM